MLNAIFVLLILGSVLLAAWNGNMAAVTDAILDSSRSAVEMLLDEESQHLAGLSDFIGKPISLRVEPTMSPEQYDIVLL